MSCYITFCDGGAKGACSKGAKSHKFSGWSFQIYKFEPQEKDHISNPPFITTTQSGSHKWNSAGVVNANEFQLVKSEFGWCCKSEAARMEYAALLYAVYSLKTLPSINGGNRYFIVCDRDNIPNAWIPRMLRNECPDVFTTTSGYPESSELTQWIFKHKPVGVWIPANAKCVFNQHVDLMATLGCFMATGSNRTQTTSSVGELYRFKVPHASDVKPVYFNRSAEHEN